MSAAWSGRKVQQARAIVRTWLPAPCGKCGKPVQPRSSWVVGHKIARSLRPDLIWVVSNWQPEHRACSDASAQAAVIERAKADALRDAGVFPHDQGAGQPPPLPVSLPATGQPIETRPDLAWSPDAMRAHPWTAEFADVPGDASPPLYMSPVPDDAVGSYGPGCVAWIEKTQKISLRWWQRLALVRQLEHREDGSLCHVEVLESAPRRAGKSVRVRGLVLWRMDHGPDLFGEKQIVIHTGSDIAVCRKLQKESWKWAERRGWKVTRANGKEAIEDEDTESEWLVKAQDAVYGFDAMLGVVDEGWKVKPDTVTEGLEPAMLERASPQLHLTSTAHRRATSLMRSKIIFALTGEAKAGTLVLIWAARHGCDPSDPDEWRAASPHWTEDRRRMIAAKYEAALAGEVDPQADDPDPMAGFVAQYLNLWPMTPTVERGDPVTTPAAWAELQVDPPLTTPDAAAIESWYSEGVSLALAWRLGSASVVSVSDHPELASAVGALREYGYRRTVTVGAGLVDDPALKGLRVEKGQGRAGACVGDLSRLMAEAALTHDGGEHLSAQVLAVRTLPGPDGPRLISRGRADALKAAVWAVNRSRLAHIGKPRIITAAR